MPAALQAIAACRVAALPVSLGIGILKFRLYDIDRIISRTLAYAIVTGVLIGLYAGLVLLATDVLTLSSPVAVDAGSVTGDLAAVVQRALQPASLSVCLAVWLRELGQRSELSSHLSVVTGVQAASLPSSRAGSSSVITSSR
jgi:hypothetical protein